MNSIVLKIAATMVSVGFLGVAPMVAAAPVQLAQDLTLPTLSADLKTSVDNAVAQALASLPANADPQTIANAVSTAIGNILNQNAAAIVATPALAASIAQEATADAASSGLSAAALTQVAASIAGAAAAAAPTEAAQIFIAVVQAIPPALQTTQTEIMIAQAVDSEVPGSQITASIQSLNANPGGGSGPNGNAYAQGTAIAGLLTVLVNQENASPE